MLLEPMRDHPESHASHTLGAKLMSSGFSASNWSRSSIMPSRHMMSNVLRKHSPFSIKLQS